MKLWNKLIITSAILLVSTSIKAASASAEETEGKSFLSASTVCLTTKDAVSTYTVELALKETNPILFNKLKCIEGEYYFIRVTYNNRPYLLEEIYRDYPGGYARREIDILKMVRDIYIEFNGK